MVRIFSDFISDLGGKLKSALGAQSASGSSNAQKPSSKSEVEPAKSAMGEKSATPPATAPKTPAAPPKSAAPGPEQRTSDLALAASKAMAAGPIKIEDERSLAMAGTSITFSGQVLTASDGPLKIPEESRNLCALFDSGLWLVSASHRHSPLVTSVAQAARRQGLRVDEPRYVTPNIVRQAYQYADRRGITATFDENAVRRRAVATIERAVEVGANDIHIEAVNNRTRVEFRIDGALRVWETWTQREGEQLLSAIYSHSIGQSGSTANWMEPQAAMLTSDTRGKEAITLPKGVISVRCQ